MVANYDDDDDNLCDDDGDGWTVDDITVCWGDWPV